MHVLHVVGARPNFMKAAPVMRALGGRARQTLVHTGQHYDREMSEAFFGELDLPEPDDNLAVGSDAASVQTGRILIRLDPLFDRYRPDVCVVYGDVNSTLAAALAAARQQVPVAHVEAGLRSYDRTMPEELNRELTDRVADWLFTPSLDADENLVREGIPATRIHRVGNVMVDTLARLLPHADTGAVQRAPRHPDRRTLRPGHAAPPVDRRRLGSVRGASSACWSSSRRASRWCSPSTRGAAPAWRLGAGVPPGCGCWIRWATSTSWPSSGRRRWWSPTPAACRRRPPG